MKTISRIAYSNDKKNKTRSILIMMSICLTTMLLVIISTVGNGMIRLQKSQAAGSYGSNYGLFVAADASQLKEVNRRAEIDATGTMCTEGIIKGNENGGFVCMDETARKMLPYNKEYELKEGKYPGGTQEIAAGRAFFSEMGYDDVKVGDTVTLDYRAGMQSEYKPEEFVVSGILYDRDEYTIEASYVAFGSQEFYDEHVAENDRQYNIYFTLNDSANVSMNNIDSVIKQIAAACGIEEKNVIVNDLYLQWVLQPSYETIAVCGVLILAIVLFSVVVIYNIFQVGIANKIQEYGKIKALGATKKQMKQLIFREGIFLTFFSIPVGLLLGFLIAKCGFNWLVEQGNLVSTGTDSMGVQNQQVPLFSLPVILLCIFVSFLTVALALRKPMKIVSRISPIEATRYLENAETHKKGKRNGRKNVTVFSMAMANITGNPKRTIGTILTLGLSCALFVIISNYVGNIDTEHEARLSVNHGQFELQLDYSAEYDERYPENNLDTILTDNSLNDSLIEEIKSIPGVTDVMTREIVSVNLNGTRFPAAIVSKKDFDFMRQDGDIGSMDYDQAVKNGEIFFGWSTWMEQDGYAPGESIAFDFENGSGTYTYQGKVRDTPALFVTLYNQQCHSLFISPMSRGAYTVTTVPPSCIHIFSGRRRSLRCIYRVIPIRLILFICQNHATQNQLRGSTSAASRITAKSIAGAVRVYRIYAPRLKYPSQPTVQTNPLVMPKFVFSAPHQRTAAAASRQVSTTTAVPPRAAASSRRSTDSSAAISV